MAAPVHAKLSEADQEELLTVCHDKLLRSWSRLQYPTVKSVVLTFRLLPDGTTTKPVIVQPSGVPALDFTAVEAVGFATPFERFYDNPLEVQASFYTGDKNDVRVSFRGGPENSLLARKIAINKKYHLNSVAIMLDRIAKAEKVMGKNDIRLWESVLFLANEYRQLKDWPKAESNYARALELAKKAGEDSTQVAKTLTGMGELAVDRDDTATAEKLFDQVIAMPLAHNKDRAGALQARGKLYYKVGKTKEGDELFARIKTLESEK